MATAFVFEATAAACERFACADGGGNCGFESGLVGTGAAKVGAKEV